MEKTQDQQRQKSRAVGYADLSSENQVQAKGIAPPPFRLNTSSSLTSMRGILQRSGSEEIAQYLEFERDNHGQWMKVLVERLTGQTRIFLEGFRKYLLSP